MTSRFIQILHRMLESSNNNIIWGEKNQIIFSIYLEFELGKYFRTNQIKSFIRQLNLYGFKCVVKKNSSNKYIYEHPLFTKTGENLELIKRKKSNKKTKKDIKKIDTFTFDKWDLFEFPEEETSFYNLDLFEIPEDEKPFDEFLRNCLPFNEENFNMVDQENYVNQINSLLD